MPRTTAATPKPCGSVRALSGGSTKEAENAYPRPRDRRLSRKTRAAVGKPTGSANAVSAVSTADNPDAVAVPTGIGKQLASFLARVPPRKRCSSVPMTPCTSAREPDAMPCIFTSIMFAEGLPYGTVLQ